MYMYMLCRWVMKRMDMEFLELLNTTAGKLLAQIVVKNKFIYVSFVRDMPHSGVLLYVHCFLSAMAYMRT